MQRPQNKKTNLFPPPDSERPPTTYLDERESCNEGGGRQGHVIGV